MRWDDLFRDLEGQLDAAAQAEAASEVAERTRREQALLRLVDRLRPLVGTQVAVTVQGAGMVRGVVRDVGSQWLLLDEQPGAEVVVPLGALVSVSGLVRASAAPGSEGAVVRRLGLAHALRAIARDRSTVALTTIDGGQVTGTIDRVGADFVEVAEHALGEARRAADVRGVRAVPHAAIGLVRRW